MILRPQRHLATLLFLLLVMAAPDIFSAPPKKPPTLDFTKGDLPDKTHDWTLGATGARGWMWAWRHRTTDARQILVTLVDNGSPADGVLRKGDVIPGVGDREFDGDARILFGHALTEAERTESGGKLRLIRWRNGQTRYVTLMLKTVGSYCDTAPYHCEKSRAIFAQGVRAIADRGLDRVSIPNDLNALALLAPENEAYRPLLADYAKRVAGIQQDGLFSWHYGYANLFLAEYYLATRDPAILPGLRRVSLATARKILAAADVSGGLVVHVGCGDGQLTAALRAGNGYLIQGLARNPRTVRQARKYLDSRKLYGPVSIERVAGDTLPYADNVVNLLVMTADQWTGAGQEIERVLAPGGVAMIRGRLDTVGSALREAPVTNMAGWTKYVKPWPSDIDQWTHYLHGPDNNAVAQDRVVGPPRHFQWIGKPRFSRSHDHLASVSALVTAGGRVFYIVDMGSIAFAAASPCWRLVARDAFSGVILWQREIGSWEYHLRDFRSGPADITRRLVADKDHVYVTLGYGQPVSALDAATGKTIRTYTGTEGTHEIIHYRDELLLVLGKPNRGWPARQAQQIVSQEGYKPPFENGTPPAYDKQLVAVNAATGALLWRQSSPLTHTLMPMTLAAAAGYAYFQNTDAVVCLDATTGQVKWQTPRKIERRRLAWSTPTLVVHDGIVFSADRKPLDTTDQPLWIPSGGYHEYIRGPGIDGEMIALDAKTGKRLWSCPAYEGFNAPVDVMVVDGLVWTGRYAWGRDPGITAARDPRTGEIRKQRPAQPMGGHARCHRAKATAKYLILGRVGVEFLDVTTDELIAHRWIRGMCQYGVMPANGLLYIPPHSCVCSIGDMVKSGFVALAPAGAHDEGKLPAGPPALEKGSAHDADIPAGSAVNSNDWPTYRHDTRRSGMTPVGVPRDLHTAWTAELGGKLTAPVIAGNRVLVAETDTHRVVALDATTGTPLWTHVAGARIDSPPTIHAGRVLFGSADGHVYCVRLDDGALIWKFRAAPRARMFVVDDQLESAWPVSGSVLVLNNTVYFAAGRNSYVDGGMVLYKLDVATGEVIKALPLAVAPSQRNRGKVGTGFLPDVLSTDGRSLFMRGARFDLDLVQQKPSVPHLWSSVGFLDASWWHRTYWQFGTSMGSGWGGWPKAGQRVPAGRLLVTDGKQVLGFGRNQYDIPGAHVGIDAEGVWGPIGKHQGRWTFYQLFKRTLKQGPAAALGQTAKGKKRAKDAATSDVDWTERIPVLVQAMLLAHDTLLVAGPTDPLHKVPHDPVTVDALANAIASKRGGRLLMVAPADGTILADHALSSPPVFDGMAAAAGRLYLSTKNGTVVCLGPKANDSK